jgi:hypothetical protein
MTWVFSVLRCPMPPPTLTLTLTLTLALSIKKGHEDDEAENAE